MSSSASVKLRYEKCLQVWGNARHHGNIKPEHVHFVGKLCQDANHTSYLETQMHIPSLKELVSEEEWKLRCELAATYRLVAMYGWSDLVFTHISLRLPDSITRGEAHFLINPYGLMFDEITASSLVKVDMGCNKLSPSEFPVNPAGFTIHSAIHAVRHDAHCVMHTHTKAGVAVSALESGLLPISQHSTFVVNNVAYHDYEGLALRGDEIPRLQADLDDKEYLILRNHGLLTTGKTAADAFLNMYIFETACQIQIAAQACGPLIMIPSAITNNMAEVTKAATAGQGVGIAWPALMRKLDRTDISYRT